MSDAQAMRRDAGTYVLVLRAESQQSINVGSVGMLEMRPGTYAYIGSAFGPGGVRARVERHVEGRGERHWHVDYVRPHVTMESVWFTHDECRRECTWTSSLRNVSGVTVPLDGFGSSDCDCSSHLLTVPGSLSFSHFRERVHSQFPEHARIRRLSPTAILST